MIFDLNTCKSDSKECSRYYRTDECCTVSADNHCDCYVCRIYTKLVSDTDQNRKKSEEVRICTEQSSINLISMQVRIASFLSGYLLVRYGSYPFSSTNFLLYATICSIMYPSSFLCFLTSSPFLFFSTVGNELIHLIFFLLYLHPFFIQQNLTDINFFFPYNFSSSHHKIP